MPRSGTSVISEAISLHKEVGWLSNILKQFPAAPQLALINRLTDLPQIGWYFRGKKKQKKGLTATVRRFLPFSEENFPVWMWILGKKFGYDYLAGQVASDEEKEQVLSYMNRVLRYQGKSRLFAKFTGPPRICYLSSIFPEAFYIHLLRDPRAVTASLMRFKYWREGGGLEKPWWEGLSENDLEEWENSGRSPIALAAIQWRRVISLTREEKDLLEPEHYLEIKYEDFVERPHELLKTVFSGTDLEDSPTAHRYLSTLGRAANMNYKFREFLTDEEIILIERITRPAGALVGYEY